MYKILSVEVLFANMHVKKISDFAVPTDKYS